MIAGILYVLSVFVYGAVSVAFGYVTVYLLPVFTPTGGMILAGLFFFVALFLHEVTLYRRHRWQTRQQQALMVDTHQQLFTQLEGICRHLASLLQHRGENTVPMTALEELQDIRPKVFQQPQKVRQLLDLTLQMLDQLVKAISQHLTAPGAAVQGPTLSRDPGPQTALRATSPQPYLETKPQVSPSLSTLDPYRPARSWREAEATVTPLRVDRPPLTATKEPFYTEPARPELSSHTPTPSTLQIAQNLHEAVRHERIELLITPVVTLPQRRLSLYQCTPQLRCADGWTMLPEAFRAVATQEKLNPFIDHALLAQVIQKSRLTYQRQPHLRHLCSVTMQSLEAPDFIESFTDFSQVYPEIAARILFQISGEDFQQNLPGSVARLQTLIRQGLSFALDQPLSLDLPPEILADTRFRFITLRTRQVLQSLHQDPTGRQLRAFQKQLEDHGTELIVSHIEDEKVLLSLLDFDIPYGQGSYLQTPAHMADLKAV